MHASHTHTHTHIERGIPHEAVNLAKCETIVASWKLERREGEYVFEMIRRKEKTRIYMDSKLASLIECATLL